MTIERIPILTSADPEGSSSTGAITFNGTSASNVLYDRYIDGRMYATQRQGVIRAVDAGTFGKELRGRGAFFWDSPGITYIVNNGEVTQEYAIPVGNITGGVDPVYFVEVGDTLVILDPENNEGWYIDSIAPTTLNAITDLNFPPNQSPVKQLAGGGASLNTYLYVMDTEGTVYNSNLDDPSTWNALDFVTAERYSDKGVFLTTHMDHIVAMCSSSIEFFYDAGYPVGSPLQRRQDILHSTGALDRKSCFMSGNKVFFIGAEDNSTIGFYQIEQFTLVKRSTYTIDRALSFNIYQVGIDLLLAGGMANNHFLCYLTGMKVGTDPQYMAENYESGTNPDSYMDNDDYFASSTSQDYWEPLSSFVYDLTTDTWSSYSTELTDFKFFSVVSAVDKISSGFVPTSLMLTNGDILQYDNREGGFDSPGFEDYVEDDILIGEEYVEDEQGYILSVTIEDAFGIDIELTLPEVDFGISTNKFPARTDVIGASTTHDDPDTPLFIEWSDDHYQTFSTPRAVDTGFRRKTTRNGNFKRRAHRLSYSGKNKIRLEAIELDIGASRYA